MFSRSTTPAPVPSTPQRLRHEARAGMLMRLTFIPKVPRQLAMPLSKTPVLPMATRRWPRWVMAMKVRRVQERCRRSVRTGAISFFDVAR